MRIFIAYGYNPRDLWIEQIVFPLVEAFGSTVVHGKDIQGERLTMEVKQRIEGCDGLVAFATRRGDQPVDGKFPTHRWVTDELAFASAVDKLVAEVRETDVNSQGGIAGDRARINYDEANRIEAVLQLTHMLARWHRQLRRVRLVPLKHVLRDGQLRESGIQWLRARLNRPGFRCQYQLLEGAYRSDFRDIQLESIEGRLYFNVTRLPVGARLRVQISTAEGVFLSDFENVDDVNLVTVFDAPENQLPDPRPRGLEVALKGA